jgi:hypothetical protein
MGADVNGPECHRDSVYSPFRAAEKRKDVSIMRVLIERGLCLKGLRAFGGGPQMYYLLVKKAKEQGVQLANVAEDD